MHRKAVLYNVQIIRDEAWSSFYVWIAQKWKCKTQSNRRPSRDFGKQQYEYKNEPLYPYNSNFH